MEKELIEIYDLMYKSFGSRNWWPADTDFEVIVGAILTQSVTWKSVEIAIDNLKRENLMNPEGILEVDIERLGQLIKSTRYYMQKAKKLKVFCLYLKSNYDSNLNKLFDKHIYDLRSELLSLYGIGEETADSMILYAARKPIFVVDAYTRRIFSRLGFFEEGIKYKDMQNFFMQNLKHEEALFNEYHAQIVAIGNNYCYVRKPKCKECPINIVCKWGEIVGKTKLATDNAFKSFTGGNGIMSGQK